MPLMAAPRLALLALLLVTLTSVAVAHDTTVARGLRRRLAYTGLAQWANLDTFPGDSSGWKPNSMAMPSWSRPMPMMNVTHGSTGAMLEKAEANTMLRKVCPRNLCIHYSDKIRNEALHELVGVMAHDFAVFACAWFGFVCVDNQVVGPAV